MDEGVDIENLALYGPIRIEGVGMIGTCYKLTHCDCISAVSL